MNTYRDDLTEALADCLERVEAGSTPTEALGRHPEMKAELAPLLMSAMSVRTVPPRPVRPTFRAELHRELVRLEETVRSEANAASGPGRRVFALPAGASIVALIFVLGALVVASADARPGDTLHPVRGALDQLMSAMQRATGREAATATQQAPTEPAASFDGTPRGVCLTPTSVTRYGDGNTIRLRSATARPEAVVVSTTAPSATGEPESVVIIVVPAPTGTVVVSVEATKAPTPESRGSRDRTSPTEQPPSGAPQVTEAATEVTPAPSATSTSPGGTVSVAGMAKIADGGDGKPLPGLTVSIYRAPACPMSGVIADYLHHEVRTDSAGAYAMHVPPGVYVVSVRGRTDNSECLPLAWFLDGGPVVESNDPCGVATNVDLTRGISAPLGYPLLYAGDVDTSCP